MLHSTILHDNIERVLYSYVTVMGLGECTTLSECGTLREFVELSPYGSKMAPGSKMADIIIIKSNT